MLRLLILTPKTRTYASTDNWLFNMNITTLSAGRMVCGAFDDNRSVSALIALGRQVVSLGIT
jgi:hypothetical protein